MYNKSKAFLAVCSCQDKSLLLVPRAHRHFCHTTEGKSRPPAEAPQLRSVTTVSNELECFHSTTQGSLLLQKHHASWETKMVQTAWWPVLLDRLPTFQPTLETTILQHPMTFMFNDFQYVLWEFLYAFSFRKFCEGFSRG